MSRIATFAFRRQVDRAQVSPTQPSPLCPLRAKQIGRARRPFREGLTGAYCTPNAVRPTTSGRWSAKTPCEVTCSGSGSRRSSERYHPNAPWPTF